MPEQYDDTNRGVLFVNDKDGNEARPDFTGKVNVAGTEYRLAAWKRTSKAGNNFLSLNVSELQQSSAAPAPVAASTDAIDW